MTEYAYLWDNRPRGPFNTREEAETAYIRATAIRPTIVSGLTVELLDCGGGRKVAKPRTMNHFSFDRANGMVTSRVTWFGR